MKRAFGLDLAGYSTGKTASAEAWVEDGGPPIITILCDCPFAEPADGGDLLRDIAEREVAWLRARLQRGPVFVDVPIDLRDLPAPKMQKFVWQLTKRPVDRAFSGLPPLADNIGACVARMQNL